MANYINSIFNQGIENTFISNDSSGVPSDWYTDASSILGSFDLSNNDNNYPGLRFNQSILQDVSNLEISKKYRLSWKYFTDSNLTRSTLRVSIDNTVLKTLQNIISTAPIQDFYDFTAFRKNHTIKFSAVDNSNSVVNIDDIEFKKIESEGIVLPGTELGDTSNSYISLDSQALGGTFTLSTWAQWNDISANNQYLINFNDSIKEYPYIKKIKVETNDNSKSLSIRELQVWSGGVNVAPATNPLDYYISSKSLHLKTIRIENISTVPVNINDIQVWAYNENYIDVSNTVVTQSSTVNLKKLRLQTTQNESLKVKKLELWVDGINIADNSYNITSQSSIVGGNTHFNMIDNDLNTYTETSSATGEFVQLDLSSAISIDTIENIKYFPFEPNSDQSSVLQLFDESENILYTFDNSIVDVSATIYQYAGPSYNYNTSSQSVNKIFPYTGSELLHVENNDSYIDIKFGGDGIFYGLNSSYAIYKDILGSNPRFIFDIGDSNRYNNFQVDKYGNIYFCQRGIGLDPGMYVVKYDSVNDTYSNTGGNRQSLKILTNGGNNIFNLTYEGSVQINYEHPLIYWISHQNGIGTYNVDTEQIVNENNYVVQTNLSYRLTGRCSGMAHDSQGNIFLSNWQTGSISLVYKTGTIFGSNTDYSGNSWIVDNIYVLTASNWDPQQVKYTAPINRYDQEGQHLKDTIHYETANIHIDSNDDIYFSSYNNNTQITIVQVDGETGITRKAVGAGYPGTNAVSFTDGAVINQLRSNGWAWENQYRGPNWTMDNFGNIWFPASGQIVKAPRVIQYVNTKLIDSTVYDIVNDQSNGYTNIDYKRSTNIFGEFLKYRTKNTSTEYIDFTLANSIPVNDLQAIVITSLTDVSYNRLYNTVLYDQSGSSFHRIYNNLPATNYYVLKYKGPKYSQYNLGFSSDLSSNQIVDDNANITVPSLGIYGVNSKNLFGDYRNLNRIRFENTGVSSINLRELQVWKDGSNIALDCSSSVSNNIYLKKIEIETEDLIPLDSDLASYVNNLDHHIDFLRSIPRNVQYQYHKPQPNHSEIELYPSIHRK